MLTLASTRTVRLVGVALLRGRWDAGVDGRLEHTPGLRIPRPRHETAGPGGTFAKPWRARRAHDVHDEFTSSSHLSSELSGDELIRCEGPRMAVPSLRRREGARMSARTRLLVDTVLACGLRGRVLSVQDRSGRPRVAVSHRHHPLSRASRGQLGLGAAGGDHGASGICAPRRGSTSPWTRLLFVAVVSAMLSGFVVSRVIGGVLGYSASPFPIWHRVHSLSADATIVLGSCAPRTALALGGAGGQDPGARRTRRRRSQR